ncbi:MAG: homocitrate synthase [bacterium]
MREENKDRIIKVVDTTLRDGEETAGVVFSIDEKIGIARLLDKLGVDEIEAGIPVMGGEEKKAIKEIVDLKLKAVIMGWNRAEIKDIDESLASGVSAVSISSPSSDLHIKYKLGKNRAWVLSNLKRAIDYAKSNGLYVCASAEDASRADAVFLLEFAQAAKESGADRFRFCDTVGVLSPSSVFDKIKTIKNTLHMPVEVHMHNDFGMATANIIAGIEAGADFANVTVNGLGERAGNAALEEVVMVLKYIKGYGTGVNISKLKSISEYVAKASGRDIHPSKPIVGSHIFMHESGIHVESILKNNKTYEAFSPEEVGLVRQIVIGKYSGIPAVIQKFSEYSISLDEKEAAAILKFVRLKIVKTKRALFDKELVSIYFDHIRKKSRD